LLEPVVQLRRLVVGEANRVPELARVYYEQAPARTLAAFAACFSRLHDRGLLYVPEAAVAAEHFAFLVVGRCIDQALFYGGPPVLESVDPERHAHAGVRVFLAGYRPRTAAD
jgi:TetR/AcrR family transcriptional regulator, mexJK operon transcriptional repressor